MRSIVICLLFPLAIHSQQKPLSIGDTLPPSIIASLSHLPHRELQTPNYELQTPNSKRQTAFILDFFATYCTACIKALPKMDSLQKQFNDQLQVVIIAKEPQTKLDALKKNNAIFANCTLPIVTGDTIFKKLFPHNAIPHEVWIDNKGVIKAITNDEQVTKANVASFLADSHLNLPLKKDWIDFDHHQPIPQQNIFFRSIITGRIDGIGGKQGMTWSADSSTKRYFFINRPVRLLYKSLGITTSTDDRIVCYEITIPANTTKVQMQQWMLQDLDRFFKSQ